MKIVKPKDLAGIFRFFQDQRRYYVCLSAIFFFPFGQPRALMPEQKLWTFTKKRLPKGLALDEGMPKPRGEYLVCGSAFAPGGGPASEAQVRVEMGSLAKDVMVFGDRVWEKSPDHFDRMVGNSWMMGPAQPFTEMPLTWERAFGWPGLGSNPVGKGRLAPGVEPVAGVSPLPNLERPDEMMAGPWAEPRPVGLMPRDISWPARTAKAGTFDDAWLRGHFPGPPPDMDWGMYSAADDDQQAAGYWSGGEDFRVRGMHPDKHQVGGRLPGLRPRAFLKFREGDPALREVPLDLDTVWLFPAEECGALIYRGTREIASWDGVELGDLLLAYEYQGGKTRAVEDYQTSLANRRQRGTAGLWSLRQDDLQPPEGVPNAPEPTPPAPPRPVPARLLKAQQDSAKEARDVLSQAEAKVKELCKKAKIDPKPYLAKMKVPAQEPPPPLPTPPRMKSLADLPALMAFMSEEVPRMRAQAKQMRAQAMADQKADQAELAQMRAQAEAKIKAMAKEQGLDTKDMLKPKPPAPGDDDLAQQMRAAAQGLGDPAKAPPTAEGKAAIARAQADLMKGAKQVKAADAQAKKAAAMAAKLNPPKPALGAHVQPKPKLKPPPQRLADGRAALAKLAAGESLAGEDLTGADLTGADLGGADLKGTILESAILTGADLSGADLSGAVLTRARLDKAKLAQAKLAGANLGMAQAQGADLTGCDLRKAVLNQAVLEKAKLAGCRMEGTMAQKAHLAGADLSGARAAKARFMECDLENASLAGADLSGATFSRAWMQGADLSKATAAKASFIKAAAKGAVLDGAELTGVRFALGADFSQASFKGVSAPGGNWRKTNLEGADFTEAVLDGGDFSRCRMAGAQLYRASAKKARFNASDLSQAEMRGVNLMQGSLREAVLSHTDLAGSNLFSVNMMNTRWDHTELQDANVKRTLLVRGGGS